MIALIGLWGFIIAGAAYAALAAWQLRAWNGDHRNRTLVAAFAMVALWSVSAATFGKQHVFAHFAESARNLAFLSFMYGLVQGVAQDHRQRAVKAVYAAVGGVIGLQIVIGGVMAEFEAAPPVLAALKSTYHIIGLTISAGALVLVHNFYGQASADSRRTIQLPAIALAAMWAYDLHLYTTAYLTRGQVDYLFEMRGTVLALIAPLFAMASHRNRDWRVQLSRAATFQSLSVLAILAYLIVMMSATRAFELIGGDWAVPGQVAIILAMTAISLAALPSRRARAWLRVTVTKHFFEHRYDYRGEWLRFTHTIGRGGSGEDPAPLEQRVVKALADIAGSPGGLLLLANEDGRLVPGAHWNWNPALRPSRDDGSFAAFLAETAYVVDFSRAPEGIIVKGERRITLPAWIAALPDLWAGVPLIHGGRLVGLALLAHAPVRRPLDWEDFDLFRTAGIQAASYIAEARSHQALADAERFDEFNRRFAFIMHDIKNLVSQLSLVARNAERHADNPEFRADMIATLQSSVRKMNELLARLSPGAARASEPPRPAEVQPLAEAIAAAKGRSHPVRVGGDASLVARVDPAGLEQALGHLVQNAIEASPAGAPVDIRIFESGGDVAIEVADRGHGMSAAFVRDRLFQPFVSTKETGFGIGAHEARCLVLAMGGRLDVESGEGQGTRFTLYLPAAEDRAAPYHERMRA
jgi:putative PEP-CTERM system histidine kinase